VESTKTTGPSPSVPAVGVRLYRYSLFVVAFTLLHIKIGAMVTSTGSGMAFADWPLSDGSLWPPGMGLDGLFEHGHRTSGTVVGMLVLALTIWVCVRDPRAWMRRVAIGALALVVLIGVLGGVGVLMELPAGTSIAHAVLAQVILCVLTLISFGLSTAWSHRVAAAPAQVRVARRLTGAGFVLVFLQLFVGAVVRHTNAQGMLWLHVFMALIVALIILIGAIYCGSRFPHAGFEKVSKIVMGLLLTQILLGFITLAVRKVKDPSNIEHIGSSLVATTHVVVGAALFLSSSLLFYQALRSLRGESGVEPTRA